MKSGRRDWDRIPARVRKDPRVSLGAFDVYDLAWWERHSRQRMSQPIGQSASCELYYIIDGA